MVKKLIFVLGVVLLGITAFNVWINRSTSETASRNIVAEEESAPAIGGDFTLTDQNGREVKNTDFKGRFMLVFFGFTHCPDICPTTLATLTNVMNALGDKAVQVVPVLITVDPARDTPQKLKEYLVDFHPSVVGLTGTQEQVDTAIKAYKVYAARRAEQEELKADTQGHAHGGHESQGGHEGHNMGSENYNMDHSGFIYLMGRSGEYVAHFSSNDSEEKITAAVKERL